MAFDDLGPAIEHNNKKKTVEEKYKLKRTHANSKSLGVNSNFNALLSI